jgi:hypothetical protein
MQRIRLALLVLLAFGVTATLAWPDSITIEPGNNPQSGGANVLFNQPGLLSSGTEVQGATQSGFVVDFSGSESLMTPAKGQARITAADGDFSGLTIKPNQAGTTFTDYIFDVRTLNNASGTLTITVDPVSGTPITDTFSIGRGENFFTILASEAVASVNLSSTVGLESIEHNRLSGISSAPIPEPTSLLLFGSGLAGLATRLRRRKDRS